MYQSKECVVKIVSESGKRELFARQLTPRERPNVTLRPSWVHTRSNIVRMLRETESNVQAWNSDPNASGSRTWPKEEIEPSIDLGIDGIPNDETYEDECMQRIAEQVEKLKLPQTPVSRGRGFGFGEVVTPLPKPQTSLRFGGGCSLPKLVSSLGR